MTEEELVQAAQSGDREAFADLVRAHQNKVYSLACRLVGNPDDAADLTQEVFLKAWRSLPRFRGAAAFSTWLYRLTSNACVDFLRREARRGPSLPLDGEEDGPAARIPDETSSPERALEQREAKETLERALAALSPEHREILVLRELEGLSYAEIAQALELEEGTVKSRLARSRLALREILRRDGNFSPPPSSKK